MNTYIRIPNTIQSFNNTESRIAKTISGRSVYVLEGEIENPWIPIFNIGLSPF